MRWFNKIALKIALQYDIRIVQVNRDGQKLNATYRLLVHANKFNILGTKLHSIKKNTEFLAIATKKTGVETNADRIKYMTMSRNRNGGRRPKIKIHNTF